MLLNYELPRITGKICARDRLYDICNTELLAETIWKQSASKPVNHNPFIVS
jgi:hypothetical protein